VIGVIGVWRRHGLRLLGIVIRKIHGSINLRQVSTVDGEKEKLEYQKKYTVITPIETDFAKQTFLSLGIKDFRLLVTRKK